MKFPFLQLGIVLFPALAAAFAQTTPADRVCTDISGKIRVTCPGEKPSADGRSTVRASDASPEAAPEPTPPGAGHVPPAQPPPADGSLPPTPHIASTAPQPYRSLERSFARNLVLDQRDLWTSPLKMRVEDSSWVLPLAAGTAVVVLSDGSIERKLPTNANFIKQSKTFSDYGAAGYAGIVAAGYLWSRATNNDHMRETAVLSGEAAINSLLVTEGVKYIAGRSRPFEDNGSGNFRNGGSSFPSLHSAGAWSIASVVAREYPGPLTQLLAYGGAAAISAARVTSRQHFASDALVGAAIGWYAGRQVYNAHHDRENPDSIYGTFERTRDRPAGNADSMGSPYVALDSWVYAAIDRLAAMGAINTAFTGMRPWTRLQCARLVEEAGTALLLDSRDGAVDGLYASLTREFAFETGVLGGSANYRVSLDSIYGRGSFISGPVINDSFHFGQTVVNDYGRPYQRGINGNLGLTSSAVAGPLAFYVQGEYQHSPSAPPYAANVRDEIAGKDGNPVQPAVGAVDADDFTLIDAYASVNIGGNAISFGRQSLWWGPGRSSALMFSNNAAPFYMLRLNRVSPVSLPGFLKFLGPSRGEMFIGRLAGHHFPASPYIMAQKVSIKPTENLELGFSRTTIFGGGGTEISWRQFYKATFSIDDHPSSAPQFDPGDRRSGFDFTYRVPGLRRWLTLYSEALSDDDPSPLAAPRRAAFNPGIYLSHIPGLERLDFRAEAAYTDLVAGGSANGEFIYWNGRFHDSHTNQGNIIGSWVGRQGRGIQFSTNYWISPEQVVSVAVRNTRVARDFLQGGAITDVAGKTVLTVAPELTLKSQLVYERWNFPLLSNSSHSNVNATVELVYRPSWGSKSVQ